MCEDPASLTNLEGLDACGGVQEPVGSVTRPTRGVFFDFVNAQVKEIVELNFKPGSIGFHVCEENGIVAEVVEGGVAQLKGVLAGMQILAVDGEPYSWKLVLDKIAMGKDFMFILSKANMPVQYSTRHREEAIAAATFTLTGKIGIELHANTGYVSKVEEGGQATIQGVQRGMCMRGIDGQPFTGSLFKEKISGEGSFDAMFLKGPLDTESRRAIQLVSRTSRCASFPNSEIWGYASSWQLEPWHPDDARVAAYLARFGFEAETLDKWHRPPPESSVKLDVNVKSHVEKSGHTWYLLECTLLRVKDLEVTAWLAPRRLCQLRTSLYQRVSTALRAYYSHFFEDAPFASSGGWSGTTAKLDKWLSVLARRINDGALSPELCALTLFFLRAPITGVSDEETPSPDLYCPAT